jgi:hypothetical protein
MNIRRKKTNAGTPLFDYAAAHPQPRRVPSAEVLEMMRETIGRPANTNETIQALGRGNPLEGIGKLKQLVLGRENIAHLISVVPSIDAVRKFTEFSQKTPGGMRRMNYGDVRLTVGELFEVEVLRAASFFAEKKARGTPDEKTKAILLTAIETTLQTLKEQKRLGKQ